ncbi:MAG: hypothetical protein R2867_37525 [Caldilineaceae bacterium]
MQHASSVDNTKQDKLRRFVDREVLLCQTSLVEDKLFNIDDVVNFCYTDSELKEMGYSDVEGAIDNGEDWKEIYEWWVVSDWLAEKLEEQGEAMLINDFGKWWGRTCTGQAIYLDSVIEEIYDEIEM